MICNPMFRWSLVSARRVGRFSSSGALLDRQPPMASIIGDCFPPVCVDSPHLHVTLASVFRYMHGCVCVRVFEFVRACVRACMHACTHTRISCIHAYRGKTTKD